MYWNITTYEVQLYLTVVVIYITTRYMIADKIFMSTEMHDIQGVLQMQQLKRMLSTEASGAQSDRPQHAGHHLHL